MVKDLHQLGEPEMLTDSRLEPQISSYFRVDHKEFDNIDIDDSTNSVLRQYIAQLKNNPTQYFPGWRAYKYLFPVDKETLETREGPAEEHDFNAIEKLKEANVIKSSRYVDSSPISIFLVEL